jgi:hypothetical protein
VWDLCDDSPCAPPAREDDIWAPPAGSADGPDRSPRRSTFKQRARAELSDLCASPLPAGGDGGGIHGEDGVGDGDGGFGGEPPANAVGVEPPSSTPESSSNDEDEDDGVGGAIGQVLTQARARRLQQQSGTGAGGKRARAESASPTTEPAPPPKKKQQRLSPESKAQRKAERDAERAERKRLKELELEASRVRASISGVAAGRAGRDGSGLVQLQLRISTADRLLCQQLTSALQASASSANDDASTLFTVAPELPSRLEIGGAIEWYYRVPTSADAPLAQQWQPTEHALLVFDACVKAVGAVPSAAFVSLVRRRLDAALRREPRCRFTIALVGVFRHGLLPLIVELENLHAARVRVRVLPGPVDYLAVPVVQLARDHSKALSVALGRPHAPFRAPSFLDGRAKSDLITTGTLPKTASEAWKGILQCLVPAKSADAIVRQYATFASLDAAWRAAGSAASGLLAGLQRETATNRAIGPLHSQVIHRFFTAQLDPKASATL